MPNIGDYDVKLADETCIRSLCPYSGNPELSVLASYFRRESFVFVQSLAVDRV